MLSTPMGAAFLKRAAQIFRDERSEGNVAVERLKGRKLQFVAHMIHHFSWILRSEDWASWSKKLFDTRRDFRLIFDAEDLLFDKEAYKKFAVQLGCDDVIMLTGAGHLAIKTQPEAVSLHIRSFIEATEAA